MITSNTVIRRVKLAIHIFIEMDWFLLEKNANERTITHKLAEYLQILFPKLNVDCEYNRDVFEPKRLLDNENQERNVVPDIIIHHRGKSRNIAVIEVKKDTNPQGSEMDIQRLKAFKNQHDYKNAFFIEFQTCKKKNYRHLERNWPKFEHI